MQYEVGKSYAWFTAHGRGYAAVFAYPGNKRTRFLCRDRKVVEFGTATDAIAAAQLQVRKICEPNIRAEATATNTAAVPTFLDPEAWRVGRDEKIRIERRAAFRGLGKGFTEIVTMKRKGA